MFAYYGYTALIWIVALWVTGKHTSLMDLFEKRDNLLAKAMMGLILFLFWSFSVIFLPWFIWCHIQKYREESRLIKMEQQKEKDRYRRDNTETEYGFYEGWEDL